VQPPVRPPALLLGAVRALVQPPVRPPLVAGEDALLLGAVRAPVRPPLDVGEAAPAHAAGVVGVAGGSEDFGRKNPSSAQPAALAGPTAPK
jgi:hypothetical protein